jgi:hypothetical protein
VPQVKWTGSLWDCQNRVLWPEVKMRIPRGMVLDLWIWTCGCLFFTRASYCAGSEFVDPQPAETNHFSGIHVYHAQSGVLHIDDTINVIFGILSFHPTIVTSGTRWPVVYISVLHLFVFIFIFIFFFFFCSPLLHSCFSLCRPVPHP